jgi:glycosyltransferase involved in cell wall biosynthesis
MDFGFEGPFRIVPNVVDVKKFVFERKPTAPPIKILHVSTFKEAHKNISGILRVIGKLQSQRSDFEVTMVGNKFGDKYDDTISELGIAPNLLRIQAEVSTEEIAKLMRSHHIFILFSNYENLPCVVAEAHCMGMVVIGSDVGGTREMIDKDNGLIVQARDEVGLLDSLNHIMNTLTNYQPSGIQEKANQRYSYESVGEEFVEIYTAVLKGLI